MRKRYKEKKRSCSLCKPHKRKRACRWKLKEQDSLTRFERSDKTGTE
jgi:hypothetical protein